MKLKPSSSPPSPSRRTVLTLGALLLSGCQGGAWQTRTTESALSAEDEALRHKFRGVEGVQLWVDSLAYVSGVIILEERADVALGNKVPIPQYRGMRNYGAEVVERGVVVFRNAVLRPPYRHMRGYGGEFGVPRSLRIEWRGMSESEVNAALGRTARPSEYFEGDLVADHKVAIASRVPEALLEDKRTNGGVFRLKIRIHPDGPLIGWDLERARGSAPDGSKFHHAGGDFQEAFIHQGEVLRKGWYIHPRTGERIETDY